MPMTAAGAQIQGTRMRQEDAWRLERFGETEVLALIADGLGGHPAGDVASRAGIDALQREFGAQRGGREPSPREWLKHAVLAADMELRALTRSDSDLEGMATTVVALYVRDTEFWAASVGDSYLLLLRRGKLLVLNELHAEGGGVTSCVGYNLSRVDLADRLLLEPGDRFLLATDGITTLDADEIGALLGAAADPEGAVAAVLRTVEESALANQDNVTTVAVFAPS
jgi:PPM family protein phosphatase